MCYLSISILHIVLKEYGEATKDAAQQVLSNMRHCSILGTATWTDSSGCCGSFISLCIFIQYYYPSHSAKFELLSVKASKRPFLKQVIAPACFGALAPRPIRGRHSESRPQAAPPCRDGRDGCVVRARLSKKP